ncbi:MAG TPA: hypothetical protein VFI29_11225 [Hanamia sp.]|nr:hypothetical protein [Hanamia sp.]
MKKIFPLCALLFILIQNASARVWRVNNNTGVQADFTTLQAAVNAAAAGDTIYLEASPTSYGGATITKRLTIIGTGYYLTDAANPKTQWNTSVSTVDHLSLNLGSAKSVISGLYMNSYQYLNDQDITLERCYVVGNIVFGNGSNINCDDDTVRQCIISQNLVCQPSGGTFSALREMVYNNIFLFAVVDFSTNLSNTNAYFINNDFLYPGAYYCENCVFQNNIFYGPDFTKYGSSNYFAYNIFSNDSHTSGVATGNNNQFSKDMKTVYLAANSQPYNSVNNPPSGLSHDGQFQLAAGSPALNAGNINGTTVDCGAYGGPAPYILSGMPNIPSIYSLTVPNQVNSGTATINISLSSAAH